jgi:hypothetical protein
LSEPGSQTHAARYRTVNRKTAKAIGIAMPESIMLRADEVFR